MSKVLTKLVVYWHQGVNANFKKGATAQENDDDNVSEPVKSTERTAALSCTVSLDSEVVVQPTPGRGLTEDQKAAILKAFHKDITAGTKVSKVFAQYRCGTTAVMSVLATSMTKGKQVVSVLATSMTKVKQVVNYVNYSIGRKTRTPPLQSDEQTSPSKVTDWLQNNADPSTRSSAKRH